MARFFSPRYPGLVLEGVPVTFANGLADISDESTDQIERMRYLGPAYGVVELAADEPLPDSTWTLPLPSSLLYGTVTATAMMVGPDLSNDVDNLPSAHPLRGRVIFRPSQAVQFETSSSSPTLLLIREVPAGFNSLGQLVNADGDIGVTLISPESPGLTLQDWDWVASFEEPGIPDIPFQLPANTTVDLAEEAPHQASNGTLVVRGAPGESPTISGTSTTAKTPNSSLGSQVFTVNAAGIAGFTVGQYVRIASAAFPSDFMGGTISAYAGTTLTVNVTISSGATSRSDWNVMISGPQGPTGAAGAGVPAGGAAGEYLRKNAANTTTEWGALPLSTEALAGLIQIATQTEGAGGLDNTRAMTPLRVAEFVSNALASIQQPNQLYVKGVIFQNGNGTWPPRTDVTADTNRSIDWIGVVGNTTAPTIGGTGMGARDIYEQRPTS